MTARPPRTPHAVPMPAPVDLGEPLSAGIAYYRTDHELAFYLRAFGHLADKRLVVVLGLRDGARVPAADLPADVRLILTAAGATAADQIGWFVPDPLRAAVVGMTGRRPDEGLILLFPDDWPGPAPEELLDRARRWRSGPHSREDDEFFNATHPN